MPVAIKDLLAAANETVPRISPADAKDMIDRGEAVVVDVRDGTEVQATGKVPGALTVSRGLLEFKADTNSPTREPQMQPDKTVIVYCASGGRSALAGKTLQDMGYDKVFNLGGFKDWAEAGMPVERTN